MIAIFELCIRVYKARTGDLLQELGFMRKDDKYVYKYAALNETVTTELVVIAVSTVDKKNIPMTKVFVMREVNIEDQISGLLLKGDINEAREIFINRGKNRENYMQRLREFNLDAGW